jgi:hypothetical protein
MTAANSAYGWSSAVGVAGAAWSIFTVLGWGIWDELP